jgi:hypothetical protein
MHSGRISYIGKKSVVGTQSNLGLILKHIKTLAEVPILSIKHNMTESSILLTISNQFGYKSTEAISDSPIPFVLKRFSINGIKSGSHLKLALL